LKKLDLVLAWALVVVGFAHCGFAMLRGFATLFAFSFGLAVIEAGFLNVVRNQGGKGIVRLACVLSNGLLLLLLVAVYILPISPLRFHASPTAIAALAIVVAETVISIR
jgi:hypothetical protein